MDYVVICSTTFVVVICEYSGMKTHGQHGQGQNGLTFWHDLDVKQLIAPCKTSPENSIYECYIPL